MSRTIRSVLITGGAASSAATLCACCRARPTWIVNLDALTYAGNLDNLADLDRRPGTIFVQGDIGDRARRAAAGRPRWTPSSTSRPRATSTARSMAPSLRPHQRHRHAFLLEAAPRQARRALRPHFHRRGVRQPRARPAVQRDDAARPQLALLRHQGGGRPAGAGLPPHLRAGDDGHPLLEQLRALPVPREADPTVHHQRAGGQAAAGLWRRRQVRDWLHVDDHCARHPRGARERRSGRGLQLRLGERPDGLETADLRADKADLSRIEEGVGAVLDLGLDRVHSLVLLRHGKLVLDEYFYGYGPQDKQQLFSVTKSVFSTLFGIAQDQGLLNVSQKLYDFFPEYHSQRGWQRKKKQVTLGMLLSMTSGFACDDIGSPSTHAGMTQSQDWVSYCLALPLSHDPGTTWSYNGTSLQPLSFLLAERSGESISQFAREYLYGPLGIVGDNWVRGPRQITEVDAGHWLSARDMAKLGQLYLNRGLWNGKRILSEQWVEQATQRHAATNINFFHGNFDYGYLWYSTPVSWHGKNINTFFADGWGGQYIWLVPDLDLVAVMTAGNGSLEGEFRFFEKYIVNAFN